MQNESSLEVGSCSVNLIADQVAEEDAFGHREVAYAIAEMIIQENRGCAIALTGTWGSGKSTVVGLREFSLS